MSETVPLEYILFSEITIDMYPVSITFCCSVAPKYIKGALKLGRIDNDLLRCSESAV
jgi:hypothetical protein